MTFTGTWCDNMWPSLVHGVTTCDLHCYMVWQHVTFTGTWCDNMWPSLVHGVTTCDLHWYMVWQHVREQCDVLRWTSQRVAQMTHILLTGLQNLQSFSSFKVCEEMLNRMELERERNVCLASWFNSHIPVVSTVGDVDLFSARVFISKQELRTFSTPWIFLFWK